MDYAARWTEPQPPPRQQYQHLPYTAPPSHHHHCQQQPPQPSSYSSYYPNPNPNPNPSPIFNYRSASVEAGLLPAAPPPQADPYAPHGGYSYSQVAPASAGAGLLSYYYGGGGDSHGFAVKEAIRHYGADPITYAPVPPRLSNGFDPAVLPHVAPPQGTISNFRGSKKKGPKATKVVQSAFCGVCKIECNSQDVLNIHKQGKKHKKNLQKLQESITPKPQKIPVTTNPVEKKGAQADEGKAVSSEQTKRKAALVSAMEEDLETKKRKILEGGAEPNEVKVCTICNVVVNSQKVYNSHLAGQKHATMVKKQQEATAS